MGIHFGVDNACGGWEGRLGRVCSFSVMWRIKLPVYSDWSLIEKRAFGAAASDVIKDRSNPGRRACSVDCSFN